MFVREGGFVNVVHLSNELGSVAIFVVDFVQKHRSVNHLMQQCVLHVVDGPQLRSDCLIEQFSVSLGSANLV